MELEAKIEQLRQEWKTSGGTKRKILEQRGRLLVWAREARDKQEDPRFKEVMDALV